MREGRAHFSRKQQQQMIIPMASESKSKLKASQKAEQKKRLSLDMVQKAHLDGQIKPEEPPKKKGRQQSKRLVSFDNEVGGA